MSINSYLEETASNLIIKGNEKEPIDVSLNTYKDRMKDYFSKKASVNLKEKYLVCINGILIFCDKLIMEQMWISCL